MNMHTSSIRIVIVRNHDVVGDRRVYVTGNAGDALLEGQTSIVVVRNGTDAIVE